MPAGPMANFSSLPARSLSLHGGAGQAAQCRCQAAGATDKQPMHRQPWTFKCDCQPHSQLHRAFERAHHSFTPAAAHSSLHPNHSLTPAAAQMHLACGPAPRAGRLPWQPSDPCGIRAPPAAAPAAHLRPGAGKHTLGSHGSVPTAACPQQLRAAHIWMPCSPASLAPSCYLQGLADNSTQHLAERPTCCIGVNEVAAARCVLPQQGQRRAGPRLVLPLLVQQQDTVPCEAACKGAGRESVGEQKRQLVAKLVSPPCAAAGCRPA